MLRLDSLASGRPVVHCRFCHLCSTCVEGGKWLGERPVRLRDDETSQTALEVSGNGDRWRSQQGWQEWGSCQVGGPGNVWNRGHAGESQVVGTKTDEGAGIPVLGFLGVKSKVDPWPTDRQSP